MATMISEVYEAFLDAGVAKDKARRAAEALALDATATKADINEIKAILRLHNWMIGFNLAFTMAMLPMMLSILWKVFS